MKRYISTTIFRVMAVAATLPLFGCDSPCDDAWDKLRRCSKHTAEKKVFRSTEARKVFNLSCKRADQDRVRRCLAIKDCPRFRKCMGRVASTTGNTRRPRSSRGN